MIGFHLLNNSPNPTLPSTPGIRFKQRGKTVGDGRICNGEFEKLIKALADQVVFVRDGLQQIQQVPANRQPDPGRVSIRETEGCRRRIFSEIDLNVLPPVQQYRQRDINTFMNRHRGCTFEHYNREQGRHYINEFGDYIL